MRLWKTIYFSEADPGFTRVYLTPETRWGQLYLHIFHGPDPDRDPHDHPFDFWTFPFMPYGERLGPHGSVYNVVKAWRIHLRRATYIHRIVDLQSRKKVITLVWRGPKWREWGFYVLEPGHHALRGWVPWKDYHKRNKE